MAYMRYSRHARERMVERGISESEVRTALQKGRKRAQNGKIIATYSYFEVVYKIIENDPYIITIKPRW